MSVGLNDVYAAAQRLEGVTIKTPILRLKAKCDAEVHLKTENLQVTGAYKIRGAYNKIASLSPQERAKGVIAFSAGNHGRAVSYAASLFKIPATVIFPSDISPIKIKAVRGFGAEVITDMPTFKEMQEQAEGIQKKRGGTVIPPYDDPQVVAGQGTIGLEILKAMPKVKTIVAPIGGGGLIGGIALTVKEINPHIRVVGVEPEGANRMYVSLKAGKIVILDEPHTVVDAMKVAGPSELTFGLARKYVDDVVMVKDDEVLQTVHLLFNSEKLVVQPISAMSLAAVLYGKIKNLEGPVVVVLTGGNLVGDTANLDPSFLFTNP